MATQNQNQNQNHHEKKKRGFIMSFCKSRSSQKNSTPKSPEPVVVPIKPVVVSESLLPRKSINGQETKPSARRGIEAEGGGGDGGGEGRRGNNVEARKSVSQVETNLASVAAFLQVKVLVTDMPGFMQVHAFRCARRTHDSLEKFSSKHMAYNIKKEFDKVYGPAWHCIVGSSFGSFVTHSTGCFLYFSMDKLYILVFKTKVQKALD